MYIKQHINGLPVANAVANVAFNKANKVVAFGSSFLTNGTSYGPLSFPYSNTDLYSTADAPPATPSITIQNAITMAEHLLVGHFDSNTYPSPSLEYIVQHNGSLALAHVFHVTNETAGTFYHAYVDAHSGDLISVTDFVAAATVCIPRTLNP